MAARLSDVTVAELIEAREQLLRSVKPAKRHVLAARLQGAGNRAGVEAWARNQEFQLKGPGRKLLCETRTETIAGKDREIVGPLKDEDRVLLKLIQLRVRKVLGELQPQELARDTGKAADELDQFMGEHPEGFIFRLDVSSCFDGIDPHRVLDRLQESGQLDRVTFGALRQFYYANKGRFPGLGQGLAFSSDLAVFYLGPLFQALKRAAGPNAFLRWIAADDFIVVVDSQQALEEVQRAAEAALSFLHLSCSERKCYVGPVSGPFDFAGFSYNQGRVTCRAGTSSRPLAAYHLKVLTNAAQRRSGPLTNEIPGLTNPMVRAGIDRDGPVSKPIAKGINEAALRDENSKSPIATDYVLEQAAIGLTPLLPAWSGEERVTGLRQLHRHKLLSREAARQRAANISVDYIGASAGVIKACGFLRSSQEWACGLIQLTMAFAAQQLVSARQARRGIRRAVERAKNLRSQQVTKPWAFTLQLQDGTVYNWSATAG